MESSKKKQSYTINKVLNQSDDVNNLLIVIRILLIVFLVGCSDKIDYVGELVNDKPHGKGTITYENGDSYEGEWKEGKKHGQGTLYFDDGSKAVGEFREDSPWDTTLYD